MRDSRAPHPSRASGLPLAQLGEAGLIATLLDAQPPPSGGLGIGDDAALIPLPEARLVTSVDALVEDVHFRRNTCSAEDLGWKALAVNLSDLAAMGARPTAALLVLSLPSALPAAWVNDFHRGFLALAQAHGVWLAGGDTTGSPGPIMVSVTVFGVPGAQLLRRDQAKPGDQLFLTGVPGRSAAGFQLLERPQDHQTLPDAWQDSLRQAHLRPVPQIAAGLALAAGGARVALLDDSDGLACSLQHLAAASQVAVILEESALPACPARDAVARTRGVAPLEGMLNGGEDYHLVGCCAPDDRACIEAALRESGTPNFWVGEVVSPERGVTSGAWLRGLNGALHRLDGPMGYRHFGEG